VFVAAQWPAISLTPRQQELHALKNIHAATISGVIRQLDKECGEGRRNQPQSFFQERKTQFENQNECESWSARRPG